MWLDEMRGLGIMQKQEGKVGGRALERKGRGREGREGGRERRGRGGREM